MPSEESSPDFVTALARGLSVISAFGKDTQAMTLTEVGKRTNLTRATARRLLLTLNSLGYVDYDGKLFRLTPKVLELGYAYLSSMNFLDVVQPIIERASKLANESCSVAVLSGTEVVYAARVPTTHIMSITLSIGTRLPAYATSMGRVLLAELPPEKLELFFEQAELTRVTPNTAISKKQLKAELKKVREQEYALVDQELEIGLCSIAVPIRNRSGNVIAAMNFGGHIARLNVDNAVKKYLPILMDASRNITASLPM